MKLANLATWLRNGRGSKSGQAGRSTKPRFLIVHHNSFGMRHDAMVLAQGIWAWSPEAEVYSFEMPPIFLAEAKQVTHALPDSVRALFPLEAIFFMEHLRYEFITRQLATKRIVFIPNIEWILPHDERILRTSVVSAVLWKNPYSLAVGSTLPALAIPSISRMVGWTSIDVGQSDDEASPNKFRRFLHVRGLSRQKQTELVVGTWMKNPDFPLLDIVCTMSDGLSFSAPASIGHNIQLHLRDVPTAELREMQRRAGVHIIPSAVEGFGHALNEARAVASVLVTTDGAPMNDFVKDNETGILVTTRAENVEPFGHSKAFIVQEDDLVAAVRRVLAISNTDCRAIGQKARAAFLEDRALFHKRMAALLDELQL